MACLLDVNVLVALFDPMHIHHEAVHDWFADTHTEGWATSPTTEAGFVRFFTRPAAGLDLRVRDVAERLRKFCASGHHVFWPDAVCLRDETLFNTAFIQGHRQLTDVYLLGLATRMAGCLATFDRTIPLRAVVGAKRDAIQIIEAAE